MATYERLPPSGIKVIVVGAGFAGLSAAIECDRKGHSVILLEKVKNLKPLGDLITFAANAAGVFKKWENVVETLEPLCYKAPGISYFDWTGRFVTTQLWDNGKKFGEIVSGHRGEIHLEIMKHATDRGIDVRLGQNVTDYFETEDGAGVVCNGEKMKADAVIAAEGVKSPGRKIVLGYEDLPKPSGYAVYRAWYDSDVLAKNEMTKHLVINGDTHNGWIGRDKHFLATSIKNGKDFSWVLTHKDEADIDEDWQFPGKVEDVLKDLEGWDPLVHELVKATPADKLVDYKLVFRDPLPTFISKNARIVLIGDAAHPFLPTSIQGAAQAVEDGATIAACLDKSGKDNVTEGVRAYEAIRYKRVHKAQNMGVTTREQWHKADWDAIWKNPKSLHLKRDPWLLDFDPENHVYEVYDETVAKLRQDSTVPSKDGPLSKGFGPAVSETEVAV
ncbi:hypothetical protein JX265_004672 [Neoarthrinium moseri]|uniref:FAD-binding domain-containing protein n=1 Tax=Neoarthrinium moseri TaxID=1658444 RepID=A0A9Q0ASD9_9PEZI|nr:hypothetical protein JX266_012251 [Neoarthrinium moseri]KAI1874464.1 hypothetical protein JX265_004672 [Neoarthrinium moseri]